MKNALILHGAGNNSQGNWFPWLKNELENLGYSVFSPDLPDSDRPNQKKWLESVTGKNWTFDSESVLVGHSAGATLILRILEKLPPEIKIDKAILVSAPLDKGTNPDFFQYKEDLTREPFDWEKIKTSCCNFYFFASDNDPYDCGQRHARIMQQNLGGNLMLRPGEGHFNLEAGEKYRQFPELLEIIKLEI